MVRALSWASHMIGKLVFFGFGQEDEVEDSCREGGDSEDEERQSVPIENALEDAKDTQWWING